ncbi:hypothetical protein KW850_15350 [Bacillus sp. sid0103]|uniref:AlkZ-related protein n=1 Tax=Bacillus sp. sid0103 TaxID=2856337 RepID=UPI001C43A676|nr:hypothetical protein [Bacillus sp. sid0103]MBV7506640.1 hypothetical protein [Bacillus sp. sid0103]
MVDYQISTYEEAVKVIKEVGLLPLSPLIPQYPSLDSITSKEHWHTGSENDPWLWRAQFPVDGVAAYGKFIKKKSVLISREILPLVKTILGSKESVSKRYKDGLISREALELFTLISEEEGIDTRVLRAKAGMKDKEKKKPFDQALLELQGSMDIVVSGTKEKINASGEKNGWSSTSFETLDYWSKNNVVDLYDIEMEEAKDELKNHFVKIGSPESLKALGKIFQF